VIDVADFDSFKRALRAERPAVVGLDISMPGTDGVELLRYLADRQCTAQVLIISGFAAPMVGTAVRLGEALGLRIAGVLPKPLRIAEVRDILVRLGQSGCPAAA
jgi:FixJ family two-component response regulator